MTDKFTIAETIDFYPFVNKKGAINLLYNFAPNRCPEWYIKETGTYKTRIFKQLSEREWGWVARPKEARQLTGRKNKMPEFISDVEAFDSSDMPFSYVCAGSHGRHLSHAWAMDYWQNDSIQKLLLTLMPKEKSVPHELDSWSKKCLQQSTACQIQKYELYKGAKKIQKSVKNTIQNASFNEQIFHYRPYSKAIPFDSLKAEYRQLWLRYLAFAYKVSELDSLGISIEDYADLARMFCGVYMGNYKRAPLLSCFHDLGQSYHLSGNHDWKKSEQAQWFIESFPSGDEPVEAEIAVSAIRYIYGTHTLSRPVFIPALQRQGIRQLSFSPSRKLRRNFNLPSGSYDLFIMREDMTMDHQKLIDIHGHNKEFLISSGIQVLTNHQNPSEQYFIIHENNPDGAEPLPAYNVSAQLYRPEDVYPFDLFGLVDDTENHHRAYTAQSIGHSCASIDDESARTICLQLSSQGNLDALDAFIIMYMKYGQHLSLPYFKLAGPLVDDTNASAKG